MSLKAASALVDAALDRARELGLQPLTVTVLDAGGHIQVTKREDLSGLGVGFGAVSGIHHIRVLATRRARFMRNISSTGVASFGLVALNLWPPNPSTWRTRLCTCSTTSKPN